MTDIARIYKIKGIQNKIYSTITFNYQLLFS